MSPPPRILRRVLLQPAYVAGVALGLLALPVVIIGAAFLSRYVPGKWRILRIVWFMFLYIVVDAAAVVVLFFYWVGSGFGWRIGAPFWERAHYHLLAWVLRRIIASAKFTFKITLVFEGSPPRTDGPRPILVFSRHAGPGDSMLLMDGLANRFQRKPRIVLKEFLQWDPAIDILLNRLPSAFVPSGQKGRELLDTIYSMAASMDAEDVFVIFPEGGNYSRKRHLRSIEKLHEIGRPDLAERAEALKSTLPPRATGAMTALAAAPPRSDVFFVGHAGLETFETPGDIWRGMPMDTDIAVRIWHVPSEMIPPAVAQEAWLFDIWAEIDGWITERLANTAEPFDDVDAY